MKRFFTALFLFGVLAGTATAGGYLHGQPGNTYQQFGNTTYGSDGTVCQHFGTTTYCN